MRSLLTSLLLIIAAPALFAAPPTGYPQTEVTLKIAAGTLHGTLELPSGKAPFPVVLIIAGSGPTDRDGNDRQLGLDTDCYKLLAEALARNGIASLRYDKRGAGEDMLLALPENKLRFETYIGDAVAWGRQLRADRRFSTLTVIGHSEGSLIGMLAAREIPADAYVSIAGAGVPIQHVLRAQLKPKLPPDLYRQAESILRSLEQGKTVAQVPSSLDALFRPSVQPYLISWFKYDPAREIAKLRIPALIVQGERDLQVQVSDAEALKKADPAARLVLIPDMNHAFKDIGSGQEANTAAYFNPKLPIDPELSASIAGFIHALQPVTGDHHAH
ncbi:MAG: alpha/beta fold hydrolase [Gammaproteobacteria bacterium]|nr:alpha/beta hydrolase [Gammaproteobacteria bacterium]MBU6510020.1 alpha/beta hydrolase [Gammaproteobacteria bacterium]MDE1983954.1 alpha/beta fold hydrolase [Gammaproteobacteria bacterium]MDE2108130.1 alpha/beta fold hydrolase [Gammaproteobacteria bacterium]MDE2461210.1 alpha/beta fold hydrolase [Gammaproteobacteria bacterium]